MINMRYAPILLIATILLAGCILMPTSTQSKTILSQNKTLTIQNVRQINFNTQDGITIFASFYPTNKSNDAIILLHMLSRNRLDYIPLATKLQSNGKNVLAIDLRGHGDSTLQTGSWTTFSTNDFKNMILDVKAAKQFLKKIGLHTNKILGASIGANVALDYAIHDPDITQLILLSPGLDYKGLKTEIAAAQFNGTMLLAAGTNDAYSMQTIKVLQSRAKNARVVILKNGGHGTALLDNKEFLTNIIGDLK